MLKRKFQSSILPGSKSGAHVNMKGVFLLAVLVVVAEIVAEEVDGTPRKSNMITKYLNNVLDKFIAEVSEKNVSIPEVELGEGVGRFKEVEGSVIGEVTKKMDGVGSWGFKLDMNVPKIVVGGKYEFEYLEIPLLFPFFGKGRFLVTVGATNLSMQMNAVQDFINDRFNINISKFDIVMENSTVQFDNLMNDPFLSDFLNELIGNLIPDLVTMLTPPVLEALKPTIDKVANGVIFCIKTELITGKVDECIRDLLKELLPAVEKTVPARLAAVLTKETNKAGVFGNS